MSTEPCNAKTEAGRWRDVAYTVATKFPAWREKFQTWCFFSIIILRVKMQHNEFLESYLEQTINNLRFWQVWEAVSSSWMQSLNVSDGMANRIISGINVTWINCISHLVDEIGEIRKFFLKWLAFVVGCLFTLQKQTTFCIHVTVFEF